MLDEGVLAGPVALVLAVQLRDGDVALVDDEQPVLGEVVEQRVGRLARRAPVEVAAVVLDAGAAADLRAASRGRSSVRIRSRWASSSLPWLLELARAARRSSASIAGDGAAHPLVAGDVVRWPGR